MAEGDLLYVRREGHRVSGEDVRQRAECSVCQQPFVLDELVLIVERERRAAMNGIVAVGYHEACVLKRLQNECRDKLQALVVWLLAGEGAFYITELGAYGCTIGNQVTPDEVLAAYCAETTSCQSA